MVHGHASTSSTQPSSIAQQQGHEISSRPKVSFSGGLIRFRRKPLRDHLLAKEI